MSDKQNDKLTDIKREEATVKTHRYSLTKQERESVANLQSVMGILSILRKGVDHSLTLALMQARVRLNLKDADAPAGYIRVVDFDPESDELICRDVPKPPEPKKEETVAPATNGKKVN